jgi:hypothetical protein
MNLFAKFYGAISSFRFYRFVIYERSAATIRYFLLLIALASLAVTVRLELKLLDASAEVAQWMIAHLPPITIKDGRVSSPVPQPFILKDDKVGVFILDTTGKILRIDSTYDRGFLLTQDKLIFKQPRGGRDIATLNLSQVKELQVNPKTIEAWRKFFYWVSFPFVYFALYLQEGLGKLAIVLLFSLSTLSLTRRYSLHLSWAQTLILGIYAFTPVVVYEIFLAITGMNEFTVNVAGSDIPPFLLISLAIYVIFLWGGTRACRED